MTPRNDERLTQGEPLSQQLELLDCLLGSLPVAIAVLDQDLVLRGFNSMWAALMERFAPFGANPAALAVPFFQLAPGTEGIFMPAFRRVLGGETVRLDGIRTGGGGTASHCDMTLTPMMKDDRVTGVFHIVTDATERKQAEERLQARMSFENLITTISTNFISLALNEVTDGITSALRAIGEFARVDRAYITLFSKDRSQFSEAYEWVAEGIERQTQRIVGLPFDALLWSSQKIADCQVIHVPRVADLPPEATAEKVELQIQGVQSFIAVPLVYRGSAIGILGFDSERVEKTWPAESIKLLKIVSEMFVNILERKWADEATMAIENARLRAQVEATAVAAERSRLARDLHDAVTQTLFSASLIAEVLPRLWGKNTSEGLRRLEELRQLTRGALAEMRTLLLELRPAALTEAPFGDLLRQLGEATTGRARIPVSVEERGQRQLPRDVQICLYRIAQEALNNVAHHSGASRAEVRVCSQGEDTELTITDDGRGFQPGTVGPEHLGLNIMRERAEAIGATLTIESETGKGTRVTVMWRSSEAFAPSSV